MYEYLFVIYSCKKNIKKSEQLYNIINGNITNCKVFIAYGENTSISTIKEDKYLILNCGDNYEDLCEKTICLMKTICTVFPNIKGVFKCDDNIIINYRSFFDFYKRVETELPNYAGRSCTSNGGFSKWHFNKCSNESFNKPYATGPLYYLSKKSIEYLQFIDYKEYLYEDVMVGYILSRFNIQLLPYKTYYDDDNYMEHTIQNFPIKKFLYKSLGGGLGNQLFMVSSAYTIAQKNNMILVLVYDKDGRGMVHNTLTEFMKTIFKPFLHTYSHLVPADAIVYKEKRCFDYNPCIIQKKEDYLLHGYYQHKNYLQGFDLSFFKNDAICERLLKEYHFLDTSYFIHFRRGDYVNHPLYKLDIETYYQKAIQYILERDPAAHFFIVSDDIPYIKTYSFLHKIQKTFIENINTLDTFYLMSLCKKGGICANSTFSGWASILNTDVKKLIIVPKEWIHIDYEYEIPFEYTVCL